MYTLRDWYRSLITPKKLFPAQPESLTTKEDKPQAFYTQILSKGQQLIERHAHYFNPDFALAKHLFKVKGFPIHAEQQLNYGGTLYIVQKGYQSLTHQYIGAYVGFGDWGNVYGFVLIQPKNLLESAISQQLLANTPQHFNPDYALAKHFFKMSAFPVTPEASYTYDNTTYVMQCGYQPKKKQYMIAYVKFQEWNNVKQIVINTNGTMVGSNGYNSLQEKNITPTSTPSTGTFDLLDYMMAPESIIFQVKHPDGSQEQFQVQLGAGNSWYYVKNHNWEHWLYDDKYIYLASDVSPAPDSRGTNRYYIVRKEGKYGSPWCKRRMKVGESFTDGGHFVQFYASHNCRPLIENSGPSTNYQTLFAHHDSMTFIKGEKPITLYDILEIGGEHERHWFARGYGRVAWRSGWGESSISEINDPLVPGMRRDPYSRRHIPCMPQS